MEPIHDLDEALRVAEQLSLSDLVPTALYGKPANVFHVIMTGQMMGLHWTEAVRAIYAPSRGQIGMKGDLLLAKLHEAGHEYSWKEVAGESCTFVLERNANNTKGVKRTYEVTFTIEDAISAGLVKRLDDGKIIALSRDNKPLPWMQYQPDLLFWRAVARGVKRGAPEVMMGFSIQGADEREPEPEVTLQPKGSSQPAMLSPQPSTATSSQSANEYETSSTAIGAQPASRAETLRPDEAQARLRELDERMRGEEQQQLPANKQETAKQEQWPEGSVGEAVNPPASGAAEPASAASGASKPRRNSGQQKIKEELLAGLFATLGWELPQYRKDVEKACSVFFRRRIRTMRDMQLGEMTLLTERLEKLAHNSPADAYPVALADAVEGWRDGWEREEPDSYKIWKEETNQ
jgi:hypothetical protein